MERFEFRAWHRKEKFMYAVDTLTFPVGGIRWYAGVGTGISYANPKYGWKVDSDLMRFIGAKDKNGEEICQSDIVFCQSDIVFCHNTKKTHIVKYEKLVGFEGVFCMGFEFDTAYQDQIEIIGNIHQNPELLKQLK